MMKTYRVEGMSCDGCVRSVTRAVQGAQPGSKVKVDLNTGLVTVEAATTDDAAIRKAVEDAGFEFAGPAA